MTAVHTALPTRLHPAPWRHRDALLARLLHRSLDRRLAAGEAAHLSALLAVRAAQLATTSARLRIAAQWDELVARTRAEHDHPTADLIDAVPDVLRADRLVLAQGVAFAATMLDTAREAVDRLHSGGADVVGAIARAAVTGMGHPVAAW